MMFSSEKAPSVKRSSSRLDSALLRHGCAELSGLERGAADGSASRVSSSEGFFALASDADNRAICFDAADHE